MEDGGPAFPVTAENGLGHVADGMTLRDYFAAKAMQGMLADSDTRKANDEAELLKGVAAAAYMFADAMLAAREK